MLLYVLFLVKSPPNPTDQVSQGVIILVFGLPESPRYLYAHGKGAEALEVLCKVYDLPPDDPKIRKEESEVLETLKIEREHGEYRWSQLLKRDEVQTGRRVLLAYGMQFMNQMGGINLVVSDHFRTLFTSCAFMCCIVFLDPAIFEQNADTSRSGLLYHIGVGTECWPEPQPVPSPRWCHQPHVPYRFTLAHLLARQIRTTQANDVGFLRLGRVYDDDIHSA